MDRMDFLAKVPIFSLMEKKDLERIALLSRYQLFHEGDVIIKEGDRDGRLFVIVSGNVEVRKGLGSKKDRWVRNLGPYGYFGEMALIDDLVPSASVVARKDTEVLSIDQLNLQQEIERYPALAIELLQTLSRRIRAIEKTMMKMLGGLVPICASCKRIREANGRWTSIEEYISDHSDAEFTHGICPDCINKLYPQASMTCKQNHSKKVMEEIKNA